jgi:hypothetical protein
MKAPLPSLVVCLALAGCGPRHPATDPNAHGENGESVAGNDANDGGGVDGEGPVGGREGDDELIEGARVETGVLAEAERVLATMTSSTYSHKTHIEGTVYEVDCSGFIGWLLARAAPDSLAELRKATVKRPLAKHFVGFLADATPRVHWRRVGRVDAIAPGDVLAWLEPADVKSTNTGHVLLVAGAPKRRGDGFVVPIIDSTASPHGASDARKAAHTTGVGRGEIVLEVDAAGAPVRYAWSTWSRSKRHETTIVLGRPL